MNRRNSSVEILRLLCILSIVMMHVMGEFASYIGGKKMILALFLNSVFQTAVSIFFLISGYFGFNSDGKKIVRMELIILFYSVLNSLKVILSGNADITYIKMTLFPVLTGRYWFMTVYMFMLMIGKNLEHFLERLNKQNLERLIAILFVFYSLAPTMLGIRFVNDARGKGVPNMLLMYIIGRYIRKYLDEEINRVRVSAIAASGIIFVTMLNCWVTFKTGSYQGPYATEDSVFIILSSICIFLVFKSYNFCLLGINKITSHIIAIYLFEGTVRKTILEKFSLIEYCGNWYYFIIVIGIVVWIAGICIIVDIVRQKVLGRLQSKLENEILHVYKQIKYYTPLKSDTIHRWIQKK